MTANGDPRVQELLVDVAVLKSRLDTANQALQKQAEEYARRLGELNQAHERAEQVLQTYLTRESFDSTIKEWVIWRRFVDVEIAQFPTVRRLAEDTLVWKSSVDQFINLNRGRNSLWPQIITAAISMAAIAVSLWNAAGT